MMDRDPRFERQVERLHALGEYALAHFIRDIERGGDVRATLQRYAELPAEIVIAYGGGHFPPRAFAIEGGRP